MYYLTKMAELRQRFHFVSSNRFSATGGSEILWTRTAGLLLQEGHDVSISVPDIPGAPEASESLRAHGAEVYCYPLQRPALRTLPLERSQFDLVVINQGGSYDGIEWAEACVRRHLPFVTIAQAVRARSWPGDNLATRILAAFSKAKQNFFVSHGNLKLFEYQLASKLSPAAIIHNPAAMENRSVLPWPSEDEGYRLACVGRLSPTDKRQDLILQVMGQEKWKGRPLTITFVGTGNHLKMLTRMRASLGLEKQISFAGWVPDILEVWKTHHGLLQPSASEGCSLALVEAMWCGRLAIVSPVADNDLMIEDGVNGTLMENHSAQALDEAMERAWQKRSDWKTWGEQSHARILQHAPIDPVRDFCDRIINLAQPTPKKPEAESVTPRPV